MATKKCTKSCYVGEQSTSITFICSQCKSKQKYQGMCERCSQDIEDKKKAAEIEHQKSLQVLQQQQATFQAEMRRKYQQDTSRNGTGSVNGLRVDPVGGAGNPYQNIAEVFMPTHTPRPGEFNL